MPSPFTQLLLKWNQNENHRPMPWKGEKDPYKIWLSEVILQQTRVEQGWAYYEKFLKTSQLFFNWLRPRTKKFLNYGKDWVIIIVVKIYYLPLGI